MGGFERSTNLHKDVETNKEQRLLRFPIMELTPELRFHIYRMALSSVRTVLFSVPEPPPPPPAPSEEELPEILDPEPPPPPAPSEGLPEIDDDEDLVHLMTLFRDFNWRVHAGSVLPATAIPVESNPAWASAVPDPGPASHRAYSQAVVRSSRSDATRTRKQPPEPAKKKPSSGLVTALLLTNKQVYRETLPILYGENTLRVDLRSGLRSINSLPQSTRSLIRRLRVRLDSYSSLCASFPDLVRRALRYCWGLDSLTIELPRGAECDLADTTPGCDAITYANAFHILRWLPQRAEVIVEGKPSPAIRDVLHQCRMARIELDKVSCADLPICMRFFFLFVRRASADVFLSFCRKGT